MDLEAESTKIKVDTSMAKDIAVKCNELIDLQNEIKTIEEKLNKVKEQEKFLSEHAIPSLMQSAGISMIKLEDGTEVKITEGKGLPEDLFGIYTATKTKLTTKE